MATALLALFFLVLAFGNRLWGGSWLYPPAVFTALWCGLLAGLAGVYFLEPAGLHFFPLSIGGLALYGAGGLAFSMGGLFARGMAGRATSEARDARRRAFARLVLDVCLLLLAAGLPLYLRRLQSLASVTGIENFFYAVRVYMVHYSSDDLSRSVSLLDNLLPLANFVALALQIENDGSWKRRLRFLAGFGLAMAYGVATGSRAGILPVLVGSVAIALYRGRRLRPSIIAAGAMTFVAVFVSIALALRGPSSLEELPGAALEKELRGLSVYALGGLVAFDQTLQHPGLVDPAHHSISRIFLQALNKVGGRFELPSLHAEYVYVTSEEDVTNVYTCYFPYYGDFGWYGILLIPMLVGWALSWAYYFARAGEPVALLLSGLFVSPILMSGFAELFFYGLNLFAKALLFALVLYHLPIGARRPAPARGRERRAAAPSRLGPPHPSVGPGPDRPWVSSRPTARPPGAGPAHPRRPIGFDS